MNNVISWVGQKNININDITEKINECIKTKHFTNNGKNVLMLQHRIKKLFELDETKEVLMVCNGAMGLNALASGINIYLNKKIRYAVQSFTFPCSVQGMFMDSLILDTDDNMGPSLSALTSHINNYEGIVVTNCFGTSSNIDIYIDFAKKYNKILLFDNAAAPFTIYNSKNHLNYGCGCMVSLHHTKPIGFGEGGFIVFDKVYLDSMKKAICFGYSDTDKFNYNIYASNFKMSDISAIYINDYLNNLTVIFNHHTKIITYFNEKLKPITNVKLFKSFASYNESLLSTIPIIFNFKIQADYFIQNRIDAKKYYYPLDITCHHSKDLFDRIICLPLNLDVNETVIDYYINIIKQLI